MDLLKYKHETGKDKTVLSTIDIQFPKDYAMNNTNIPTHQSICLPVGVYLHCGSGGL